MSVLSGLAKLTAVEAKLFLRETGMAVLTIAFPTLLLVVLGLIPALRRPDELFGGMRFVDVFMPSLIVLVLALLG